MRTPERSRAPEADRTPWMRRSSRDEKVPESVLRIAANAVPSPQRHVQHVRDDPAPDAVHGLLEEGQSLTPAVQDGHDQAATRRELPDQRRRDVGHAAVTQIRSYGACSRYPSAPSP